jgi:arginyl-tRNA synthetase
MKTEVINLLSKNIKQLKKEEIENLLEVPPTQEMGDFAFPTFSLASKLKKNPAEIAYDLSKKIKTTEEIEKIEAKGPYINFFVDRKALAKNLIKDILKKGNNYGNNNSGKGKKIVIDMSSPNIAKPFGIGHLRSTIIGNSLSKISESQGYKTVKINYLGDWGTQFGKLIVGYKRFGNEAKLKKDPVKHLLDVYVKGNLEEYESEARGWFKKLEEGDKEATKLWDKFKELSIKEFNKLYSMLGVEFDVTSGESVYNNKMKPFIRELRNKKLLKKSEDALIVDLNKYNLGIALIEKSDGTTLYATRDIAAAVLRKKKYNFERMFYEVGSEQTLHFRQLFKILELMGHKWAKNCVHVSHGLYQDKDGKKFSTRKGKLVFMEDILKETTNLAKKQLKKRTKLSEKELEKRARKVAIAAIFYGDLKSNRTNNVVFDLDRFVSFEGDTGPYLLYSYARASSILRKAKEASKRSSLRDPKSFKLENLEEKEIELVKKLEEFEKVLSNAYEHLNPALIANYSYQLSQIFNEFYHSCPVIDSDKKDFRLALVQSFRQILKNGLNLLGIDVLEEM